MSGKFESRKKLECVLEYFKVPEVAHDKNIQFQKQEKQLAVQYQQNQMHRLQLDVKWYANQATLIRHQLEQIQLQVQQLTHHDFHQSLKRQNPSHAVFVNQQQFLHPTKRRNFDTSS